MAKPFIGEVVDGPSKRLPSGTIIQSIERGGVLQRGEDDNWYGTCSEFGNHEKEPLEAGPYKIIWLEPEPFWYGHDEDFREIFEAPVE